MGRNGQELPARQDRDSIIVWPIGTYSNFNFSSAWLKTDEVSFPSLSTATSRNLKTISATTATKRIYSVEVWPSSSFQKAISTFFIPLPPKVIGFIHTSR